MSIVIEENLSQASLVASWRTFSDAAFIIICYSPGKFCYT